MRFADPNAGYTAFLILRHLYDGDIIDWPIADDHPQREVFAQLESEGYIARWDRTWPLHDRYRLTEKGIAAIEAVYQPAGSEAFFEEIRRQNLHPAARRHYLQSRNLNPMLWPILHDPSTHWSTWMTSGGLYNSYFWEDQRPVQRRRPPARREPERDWDREDPLMHHHHHRPHHNVDLDHRNDHPVAPTTPDYDVS